MAQLVAATVARVGNGVYRVEHEGRSVLVYVVQGPSGWWASCEGQVFRGSGGSSVDAATAARRSRGRTAAGGAHTLTAPMPATVLKVLVQAGDAVKKGDTVVLLEAMKMELPLRAASDAVVSAVHCRDGELVTPDTVLVELG